MAGLFAVMTAMLLAIAISVAYALVLRELRRINANLERFIKLIVDARGGVLVATTIGPHHRLLRFRSDSGRRRCLSDRPRHHAIRHPAIAPYWIASAFTGMGISAASAGSAAVAMSTAKTLFNMVSF